MRPTIKNKLGAGFSAVLCLMGIVAAIGVHSVLSLRTSALETARVGDKLDSIALEIQVHNLEAQRKIKSYLADFKQMGAQQARDTYLDEVDFEISEIESLAAKGVKIAPTEEKRAKFQAISDAAAGYDARLKDVVQAVEKGNQASAITASVATYEAAAQRLSESAEDGELAGRDASQLSQHNIEIVSKQSVPLVVGVSLLGILIAIIMSFLLSRAILLPVEHLKDVAENVSMGNLKLSVRRFSDDEIGDLADSFSRMVTAVRFFQSEAEASQAALVMEGSGK